MPVPVVAVAAIETHAHRNTGVSQGEKVCEIESEMERGNRIEFLRSPDSIST